MKRFGCVDAVSMATFATTVEFDRLAFFMTVRLVAMH
jgi:hypothetical protein